MTARGAAGEAEGDLPQRIGTRYDVVDRLGRGGMAVVYRVRDRSRGVERALKRLILPGSIRDRETRALFEREFEMLTQLQHPSAVAVHDYGVDAAGPYYTMDLLDGGDLNSRAPMPFRDACDVMMQVCSLLSLLHARGFVHRDITPRNVRFTRDGAAKLIDFGAMVPMGPCTQAVGTPGFVAPEVVHHRALDARTDLFSVGATLYHALTGQRPFPARSLAELPEMWRHELIAPSLVTPGVPSALDALIAAMLQLDPARRPASAFEVAQRLAALSGRPLLDSSEVARAYLSTPAIVGRESQRRAFRQHLRRADRGDRGGLLLHGPAGSGRSRLLAACVLEAKLSGSLVLHAEGRAARLEPFTCARLLAAQLVEAFPDDTHGADALFTPLSTGSRRELRPVADWAADAAGTQATLSAWLERVCRSQALMIAVDDVERIDAASLALLAECASSAGHARMLVVCTTQTPADVASLPALGVLQSYSTAVALTPLAAHETDALFAAVFAGAPRVSLVSDRIHKLAAGNPRNAMALAQFMLDRELIRYADGNWILPAELATSDLPVSTEAALHQQLAVLPELARHLLQAQSLALDAPWSLTDYRALASENADAIDSALALLQRRGFLVETSGFYTLAHPGVNACALGPLSAAATATLHCALAEWCVRTGRQGFVEVFHLLSGQAVDRGLDRLAEVLETTHYVLETAVHHGLNPKTMTATLERAYELSLSSGRSRYETFEIARRLMRLSVVGEASLFERYAPRLLAQLELDSGLSDFRALPSDTGNRLQQALATASQRYANLPEGQRVYRLDQAIKHLAQWVLVAIVNTSRSRSLREQYALPALLEPFAPVSPALHAIWQNVLSVTDLPRGHSEQARERGIEVYRRLERLSPADLPSVVTVRNAVAGAVARAEVFLGYPTAEQWIEIMESDPLQRVDAQYLRRALCIFADDLPGAERYRKRAELMAAQASLPQMFDLSRSTELSLQVFMADLAGVKHAADRLEQCLVDGPGWLPLYEYAQGQFHLLRGDLLAAKAAFERAIALSDPDREGGYAQIDVWLQAADGGIRVLHELGELEAARRLGLAVCERADALGVTAFPSHELSLATVEADVGAAARGIGRLDALIDRYEKRQPWMVAQCYAARARVAIIEKERGAASRYLHLALHHGADEGRSSVRAARFARLLDDARKLGIATVPPADGEPAAAAGARKIPAPVRAKVEAQIGPSLGSAARAQRALELLSAELKTDAGQLYFARADLERVAALGPVDSDLDVFARGYWRHRQSTAVMTTVFTATEQGAHSLTPGSWTSAKGVRYALLPLSPAGEAACVGVVALVTRLEQIPADYWTLAAAASVRLQELGDLPQLKLEADKP